MDTHSNDKETQKLALGANQTQNYNINYYKKQDTG